MAYEMRGTTISLKGANPTMMDKRWRFVTLIDGVADSCRYAQAVTDKIVGVLQMDETKGPNRGLEAGQILPIMIDGISFIEAGAAIPAASFLTSGVNGVAIVGTAQNKVGYALTAASQAGDIIAMLIKT